MEATPKIAAPTSSVGTPKMTRPSTSVRSTTTSSGTKMIRLIVRQLRRFIDLARFSHDIIGGRHEGDPARRGKGHATAPAHHSHTEAHRSDLRSAVLTISAGPH